MALHITDAEAAKPRGHRPPKIPRFQGTTEAKDWLAERS